MHDVLIIGAGPAGMAAAYEVVQHGGRPLVIEKLETVGGLSRTIAHNGCLYDIGPHRFFTKNEEVNGLFQEVLAKDLLRVPRLTRIFFQNKFFNYPLTPLNAFFGVGVLESAAIACSYASQRLVRLLSARPAANFEEWVANQFGSRLFQLFFKNYTEKVWGIPCTQIGAEWAAQRIKGLNLPQAIWNAVFRTGQKRIKTLADEFLYPRLGAGQFYEKMAGVVCLRGGIVRTGLKVTEIRRERFRVREITISSHLGHKEQVEAEYFLSSAPLTEVVQAMIPRPPDEVLAACRSLRYRHHIGVHLKLEGHPFPDNWIYVHSRDLRMARIANYRNFSAEMANDDRVSPITIEYFAFPDDEIWSSSDKQLIELAVHELNSIGLVCAVKVISEFVVRSVNAYPVIEMGSQQKVGVIKEWLDKFENLTPIGRCGLFKYNNQDHAIATGLLAARKVLGLGRFDPWLVNIDAEYHESGRAV